MMFRFAGNSRTSSSNSQIGEKRQVVVVVEKSAKLLFQIAQAFGSIIHNTSRSVKPQHSGSDR